MARDADAAMAGPATMAAEGPRGLARAAVPPLSVSGFCVTRAALVAALRLWLPQLMDLEPLDGGRFLLVLAGAGPGPMQTEE